MSFFSSNGLTMVYYSPLWLGKKYINTWYHIDDYQQELRAQGGFWSANLLTTERQNTIEDWIEYGLGRHVEIYDHSVSVIWEGFVNEIEANLGGFTFSIGPLLDIGNRVKAVYSTVDTSTSPPTVGIRAQTAVANNTDSQALYGIIEKAISLAGTTPTNAEQARDLFLAENAFPVTSRQSSLAGDELSIDIGCLGYWHWLDTYTITDTNTGTVSISTRITDNLADEPNTGIFSTDYSQITTNATTIERQETRSRTSKDVIVDAVSIGDSSNNRYNAGFYEDRIFHYKVSPSVVKYNQRITEAIGVTDRLQGKIMPWNVRPAEWLFYPDFLVGRQPPVSISTLRTDPRAGFIEVVTFRAPNDLTIDGVKINNLDQLLSKFGFAGM